MVSGMNVAVIGVRVHSGWAAVLAVSGEPDAPEVIDRRRIEIVDAAIVGASQPYHLAADLELSDAEPYLANCAAASERMASAALQTMVGDLAGRGLQAAGCAILEAVGRPLPPLAGILSAHALIHTAEGEFFRKAVRRATEAQGIAVTGIRERDLAECAGRVFGSAAGRVRERLASLGKRIGPPWTQDQKAAALAATIVLAELCGNLHSKAPPA